MVVTWSRPCTSATNDSLRVAVQRTGAPVLRAAKAYESATDWRARSPDL